MYKFCDHIKCKFCGQTNCLFKLRVNAYEKRKTGNIVYITTLECKLCYQDRCRMKNDRWWSKNKNRKKVNARQRAIRKGNPHYIEAARVSYWKHRESRIQQKRDKYQSKRKYVRIGRTGKFSHKRRTVYDPLPQDHPGRKLNLEAFKILRQEKSCS